jgi:large repetitive protein
VYIEEMVFTQRASFKKLLTAKESFATHSGLAAIYGHAPAASRSAPAMIPASERRQGLLMRAAFLSGPFSRTSAIRRGVAFQKRVLCNEITSPSEALVDIRDADKFTDQEALLHTNREAIAYNTKSPVCMTCHTTINATGFAFESMDPLGRIRSTEAIFDPAGNLVRNLTVDSRTDVPLASGGTKSVQDAFDLVTHVAESSEGSACFTRNVFRYVNEKRETAEDDCALSEVQKVLNDSNKPVLDAMVELIANNTIFVKKK